MTWFEGVLGALWKALGTLPSNQIRVIWLIVLDGATAVLTFILCRDAKVSAGPQAIYNSWLLFVASLHGINLTSYLGKRATFKPQAPDGGQTSEFPVVPQIVTTTATQATVTTTKKTGKKGG